MSNSGRIAGIYSNDGAGNLTWDTIHSQYLLQLSDASLDWGDLTTTEIPTCS